MARSLDTSSPNRGNWDPRNLKGLYSLSLVHLDGSSAQVLIEFSKVMNGETSALGAFISILSGNPYEFIFSVNPQALDVEEPAAVTIVPTQDGSQYIEHQGQIYKNITISGTTGLRPNMKPSNTLFAVSNIGEAVAAVSAGSLTDLIQNPLLDDETGLPKGERTGFDDIIALKNFFRFYFTLKTNQRLASQVVMLWKNVKEADYYVVEPITFRTRRDRSSPLTANYEFSLRTISKMGIKDEKSSRGLLDVYLKIKKGVNQTRNLVKTLASAVNTFTQLETVLTSAGVAVVNDILQPANEVITNLSGFISTTDRLDSASNNPVRNAIILDLLKDNISDLKDKVDGLLNNKYTVEGITTQFSIASNACNSSIRAIDNLLAINDSFNPSYTEALGRKAARYVLNTGESDGSFIGNANATTSVAEAVINVGDTLQTLALRLLGDKSKYKDLIVLNKLQVPYISEDGDGVYVLRPGDLILYPSASSSSTKNVGLINNSRLGNVTAVESRLGKDVNIKQSFDGVFDFQLDNGDLSKVSGITNMQQAVHIKFSTERGELPSHPFFGALFSLGNKATMNSLAQFEIDIRNTVLSDTRIGSLNSLKVTSSGNALKVFGIIAIEGTDDLVPLNFTL